jgi:hypothetical protein
MSTAIDHPADRMNRLVIRQADLVHTLEYRLKIVNLETNRLSNLVIRQAEQIIRLKNQLTTLIWAAHIPLSLPAGEAMTACDIGVLRSEVDSAEALLGGAK